MSPKTENTYPTIQQFGGSQVPKSDLDHPLSYCIGSTLDHRFNHGASSDAVAGQDSRVCQLYMADYCATHFDGLCRLASTNTNVDFPSLINARITAGSYTDATTRLSQGQILIRNAALRKYMSTGNDKCQLRMEPFDPTRVHSPMVRDFVSKEGNDMTGCKIDYTLSAAQIKNLDVDPIMNRLLDNPEIGYDILENICVNLVAAGRLSSLRGTRLGNAIFKGQ
jgi:hypothetical protein